jgi:exosortase
MNSLATKFEICGSTYRGKRPAYVLMLGFLAVGLLPFMVALNLTAATFKFVLESETFSLIPLIPFVSAFLIFRNRREVFSELSFGPLGGALIIPGLILLGADRLNVWRLTSANQSSLFAMSIVLVWTGAFMLFFGVRSFRAACFPLLFLLFAVPIPEPLVSNVIFLLQKESAEAAEAFFRLGGVPYLRRDFVFELPGVAIRVAEECSGIRSTLALLVTTVLTSYLFLRTTWKRWLLCIVVVPIAIIKNGLRIMTLSTLAIYVDPGFLYGNLHHHGGVVFFMFALVPMGLLLFWLEKGEAPAARTTRVA